MNVVVNMGISKLLKYKQICNTFSIWDINYINIWNELDCVPITTGFWICSINISHGLLWLGVSEIPIFQTTQQNATIYWTPLGGFKHFLFSSLHGEDSHFDKNFSNGLKPPTRLGQFVFVALYINLKQLLYTKKTRQMPNKNTSDIFVAILCAFFFCGSTACVPGRFIYSIWNLERSVAGRGAVPAKLMVLVNANHKMNLVKLYRPHTTSPQMVV